MLYSYGIGGFSPEQGEAKAVDSHIIEINFEIKFTKRKPMKKLLIPIFLSSLLLADCSLKENHRASDIWQRSIHKQDSQKLKLLNQALSICPDLEVAYVDKLLIEAKKNPTEEKLMELKNKNNELNLSVKFYIHKWNIGKELNQLFLDLYRRDRDKIKVKKGFASKDKLLEDKIKFLETSPITGVKAVTKIGGTYKADLLFDKDKFKIKNHSLAQEIIEVVHQEVELDSTALFGLEGGASSEGSTAHNKELSQNRGDALAKAILKQYPSYQANIKVFAMGESQLVCEKGLLPERNTKGEYECLTKEDREKSRRVSIRRLR